MEQTTDIPNARITRSSAAVTEPKLSKKANSKKKPPVKAVTTASGDGQQAKAARDKAPKSKNEDSKKRRDTNELPEILDDDDYIFCDRCARRYPASSVACPTHGKLQYVVDQSLPPDYAETDRAERTAPLVLSVCESGVERGGIGVWNHKKLPVGTVFGPYQGVQTPAEDFVGTEEYSWRIRKRGEVVAVIDGADTTKANWMRFVKCARTMPDQNIAPFQGNIYYRTTRDIPKHSELMMYTREHRRFTEGLAPLIAPRRTEATATRG